VTSASPASQEGRFAAAGVPGTMPHHMLTTDEQGFLEIYRTGDVDRMRAWCRQHPDFPFRGVHNQELNDVYYRLVCDAIAKTLRYSA